MPSKSFREDCWEFNWRPTYVNRKSVSNIHVFQKISKFFNYLVVIFLLVESFKTKWFLACECRLSRCLGSGKSASPCSTRFLIPSKTARPSNFTRHRKGSWLYWFIATGLSAPLSLVSNYRNKTECDALKLIEGLLKFKTLCIRMIII